MLSFGNFLLIYVFGGLTFVPLCIAVVLCHAYYTFPNRHLDPDADAHEPLLPTPDDDNATTPARRLSELQPDAKPRLNEPDVAAAYFAVCREYVPGGVQGKPPERVTPAGTVVGVESPSVYQTMYRSLFDRNRSQSPSIEGGVKGNAKAAKKARNVFFVVLRLVRRLSAWPLPVTHAEQARPSDPLR